MQDFLRELLGANGKFAKLWPDFEVREQQIEMAMAVADAIREDNHLLVEAGTGVGKTVAYLAPAILSAKSGKPVIISTHTINLQSQLINKDIPLMKEILEDHPFNAVLMKGRSNYVCLMELDLASSDIYYADDPLFKKLKKWVSKTKTGDVQDLNINFPDWHEVCCNPDTCKHQQCKYYEDHCFYYKMRLKAKYAEIVIVNHSLFFSDLALKQIDPTGGILPEYGAVIFDEAHHIEDVVSDTYGIEFSNYRISSLLNKLKKRKDIDIPLQDYQIIESLNNDVFNTFSAQFKNEFFFDELFDNIDRTILEADVTRLLNLLDALNNRLQILGQSDDKDFKDRIDGYRRILGRARGELNDLFFADLPNYFRWCERNQNSKFVTTCLHTTPIDVADILRDHLWGGAFPIICTSATLSNSGTFSYLKSRLGLDECADLILGSPFDYKKQVLLYVPDDLEEPSDKPEYADKLTAYIQELIEASAGRAFLLFTSYRMLNAVFDRLIEKVEYRLLKQGDMSNQQLIQEFREDDSSVLLGVHSFWEGVDVKGDKLSCVIIDKLPFAVPDNPTTKARCSKIEENGGNWFKEYSIPQAQIRLKQGFGRLIRTENDRGVVAIMDSRIHNKFYGKEFMKYLPHCRGTKKIEKAKEFLSSPTED